ncbi:MAG: hypothetical protein KDH88_01080 [Chromatiales bacterium]|nr:hypothetical protein [Chromatiales bacterium]
MPKDKIQPSAALAAIELLERLNADFPQLASKQSRQCVVDWKRLMTKTAPPPPQPQTAIRPTERESDTRRVATAATPLDREIPVSQGTADERAELAEFALTALQSSPVEDVMSALTRRTGSDWDYLSLIELTGKEAYMQSLRKEAGELLANAISPRQIADLWGELGRPAIGGLSWGEHNVRGLLGNTSY